MILEDFLKRVADELEVKVRYKFDAKYMPGDFAAAGIQDAIRRKLVAKCPAEEANIKQDVGRVFGTGDLINFLSHDNPGRLEVTLPQARDFVNALKALTKRCEDNQMIKRIGG